MEVGESLFVDDQDRTRGATMLLYLSAAWLLAGMFGLILAMAFDGSSAITSELAGVAAASALFIVVLGPAVPRMFSIFSGPSQ